MPSDTNKKRAPILCAAIMIVLLTLFIVTIIFPIFREGDGILAAIIILAVYTVVIVAVIVGILIALRQRLREIEGGEEEDAKKY